MRSELDALCLCFCKTTRSSTVRAENIFVFPILSNESAYAVTGNEASNSNDMCHTKVALSGVSG